MKKINQPGGQVKAEPRSRWRALRDLQRDETLGAYLDTRTVRS